MNSFVMGFFSCHKSSSISVLEIQPSPIPELRLFSNEELSAATSNFSPSSFLGRGSHCSVYRASFDGGRLLAAAKLPTIHENNENDKRFLNPTNNHIAKEIALLSNIPHSNLLVNLLGFTVPSSENASVAIVEIMPGGSLHDLLHNPFNTPPPWSRRLRLVLRAAEAVTHLHSMSPPIVHRDIKSANILIDTSGNGRLADFGLAVTLPSSVKPAGTMGYIDPNYISPQDLSLKTDVYSFGVMLLEVVSGRRAIDTEHSPQAVVDWAAPLVKTGKAADVVVGVGRGEIAGAKEVAEIAVQCLAAEVEERPCMTEVTAKLRAIERRRKRSLRAAWRRVVNVAARHRKAASDAPAAATTTADT